MESIRYLEAAAILYHDLGNAIIEQDEAEDELFIRLDRDFRVYALHRQQIPLDISLLDNDTCKTLFRFTYTEIQLISRILGFPEQVSFRNGTNQSFSLHRYLALAIMLRRLAYPLRLVDLALLFKMNKTTISVVFNSMIGLLHSQYHEEIRFNKKHLHPFYCIHSCLFELIGNHYLAIVSVNIEIQKLPCQIYLFL